MTRTIVRILRKSFASKGTISENNSLGCVVTCTQPLK